MIHNILSDLEKKLSMKGNIDMHKLKERCVSNEIGSGLFDRSQSNDRNELLFDTQDDAMLYDTECGYAKMNCICKVT